MTLLMIMCDAGLEDRVLERLREIGVPGHTLVKDTTGSGRTGRRDGDPIWPGANSLLFVAVPGDEIVAAVRDMLLALKAEYTLPPALRALTLTAEDLV